MTSDKTKPKTQALPTEAVPIFPLPDHVLLPNFPTPYRIFEPRYCELIRDLLDQEPSERWVTVPQLEEGWQEHYFSTPPFYPTATLARLLRCRITGDQYLVAMEGVARCNLSEVSSTHMYRLAMCQTLDDEDVENTALEQAREAISQSVMSLAATLGKQAQGLADLVKESPQSDAFVYRVASIVLTDSSSRRQVLESNSPLTRAEQVLHETAKLINRVDSLIGKKRKPS